MATFNFNKDMRKGDYKFNPSKFIPRPSHADFTYYSKYGPRGHEEPESLRAFIARAIKMAKHGHVAMRSREA